MAYLRVAVALTATALLTGSVAAYPAPEAADGWSYCLVASNLTRPRGILFDTEGGLIVVDRGVGLVHYKLREQGDCFEVEETKTLVDDEDVSFTVGNKINGWLTDVCSSTMALPSQRMAGRSMPQRLTKSTPGPTTRPPYP